MTPVFHKVGVPPVETNSDGTTTTPTGPLFVLPSGTVGDNAFLGLFVDPTNTRYVCPSGSNYVITTADIGSGLYIMSSGFKSTFTPGTYNIIAISGGTTYNQRWFLDRAPAVAGASGANWNIGPLTITLPYSSGIAKVDQGSTFINPGMVFAFGPTVYGRTQSLEG